MRASALLAVLAALATPAWALDTPAVAPDMTGFDATCRASEALLNWMSSGKLSPEEARGQICTCLVGEFKLTFDQSTIAVLGKTLDGTITGAERADPAFGPQADKAEQIMMGCVTTAGL